MLPQVMQAYEMLSQPTISGEEVAKNIEKMGLKTVEVKKVHEVVPTQFLKALIPGSEGKSQGGKAPTMGLIGNLGGVGARPRITGMVSDADGAIVALAVIFKLLALQKGGEPLKGDVIVSTHICPNTRIVPHDPVPWVGNPTEKSLTKTKNYADPSMEAILHVETSRGNRLMNNRGFAITPTIKECYLLRVSNDLMDIMQNVTGDLPRIFPLTTQDVTPIDNGIFHVNGLAQDTLASDAPIVGVAITTVVPVAGCASGANQIMDMELVSRFVIEVAIAYTAGQCRFYDPDEFEKILSLYGSMKHLREIPP